MTGDDAVPVIDTTRAHPARIYDYWLGGKDNFAADREAGELALRAYPELAQAIRSNRAFLGRAVRFLAGEGVRQFLDIGTGLPASDNTHEVAQREAPESRVVYVDNDPTVLLHAQVMLDSSPEGACDYMQADLCDPDAILARAARTIDFSQPVALMLLAVLQFILDEQDPYGLVSRLAAALPSGSYLVISHPTDDFNPNKGESMKVYNERSAEQAVVRDQAATARFFEGLALVEPGVVPVSKWRPESDDVAARHSSMWCGVARKPLRLGLQGRRGHQGPRAGPALRHPHRVGQGILRRHRGGPRARDCLRPRTPGGTELAWRTRWGRPGQPRRPGLRPAPGDIGCLDAAQLTSLRNAAADGDGLHRLLAGFDGGVQIRRHTATLEAPSMPVTLAFACWC